MEKGDLGVSCLFRHATVVSRRRHAALAFDILEKLDDDIFRFVRPGEKPAWAGAGDTLDQGAIASKQITGDSQAHAVIWNEHATLDTLRDRFISLRAYGDTGLVFGFSIQKQ